MVGDTPVCDVLAFAWFITEVDLHPQSGNATAKVIAFPTNSSPTSPVVEVGTLRGKTTLANVGLVPTGTYDRAILTITVNDAAFYDPTVSPPTSLLGANVTTTKVTVNIQPPLKITEGKVSMLRLDFNLLRSFQLNSQGQLALTQNGSGQYVNENVIPVLTANPVIASGPNGFGEMDTLYGFVQSVNTASPGLNFTGALQIQTLSGRGPSVSADFTSSTQLIGASALNQVTTGSFVDMDGYIDSGGNFVANSVQVQDRDDITQNLLAYIGPVVSITRDVSGNVSQFAVMVRDTEPNNTTDINGDSNVIMNFNSSTGFKVYALAPDLTNLATAGNLTFSPDTLQLGQEVVVHGVFTKPASGAVTVAANNVYLRLQPVQGSSSNVLSIGSDDKTGAFQFAPCSDLLNGLPYIVVTDGQTNFINLTGLSAVIPSAPLIVNGLVFYDPQGSTINGVTIPPNTMVILAKQVQPL